MSYQVEIERRALKAISKLPAPDRLRIAAAIDSLADDPRPPGCQQVQAGPNGTFRIRVGDYRIICVVLDEESCVIVARVARKDKRTYADLS
jgi:mRNA interferase RelE/StbE